MRPASDETREYRDHIVREIQSQGEEVTVVVVMVRREPDGSYARVICDIDDASPIVNELCQAALTAGSVALERTPIKPPA